MPRTEVRLDDVGVHVVGVDAEGLALDRDGFLQVAAEAIDAAGEMMRQTRAWIEVQRLVGGVPRPGVGGPGPEFAGAGQGMAHPPARIDLDRLARGREHA